MTTLMIRFCFAALLAVAGLMMLASGTSASPARKTPAPVAASILTIDGGRLGQVVYTLPAGQPNDVIILFADPADPAQTRQAMERLGTLGAAVALIDTRSYFATLAADKGDCLWLSSDIERLNHSLQRKPNFPEFRLPVLASLGSGGTLVYVLLSEAPSYSFAGGVSVGFTTASPGKLNFCGGPTIDAKGGEKTPELRPQDINLPWIVAGAEPAQLADWIDGIDKAESKTPWPGVSAADELAGLAKPMLEAAINRDPNSLDDLPLIEMPSQSPQPYVAIIYSGDGGWRDLDRTLGQVLAASGVPVVGIDSLLYFWQPKRPELVAHDLDRIIEHYRKTWKTDRFVVIGYSFGADIMPFAYNRLLEDNKARVVELSLLALSHNANFEISAQEYFSDDASDQTRPIEPELQKLPKALVQCFYGEEEAEESACTSPAAKDFEITRTAGGHHFGDDYDALAKRIISGAKKRLGKKT